MKPAIERLDDDPAVSSARQQHHEARQQLQAAEAARAKLAPEVGRVLFELDLLEATRVVARAEAAAREAKRQAEAAEHVARDRIVAGRQPGRVAALTALLTAAETACDAAAAVRRYDEETAARIGLAPGEHPLPVLLGLGDSLGRLRQELAGRPEPVAPLPVPAGKRRVKVVEPFTDRDGLRRDRGVEVLAEEDAVVALKKGWATV